MNTDIEALIHELAWRQTMRLGECGTGSGVWSERGCEL